MDEIDNGDQKCAFIRKMDDPIAREGDSGFVGFASRINPLNLPLGVAQMVRNMRLDRGVAQTRKGASRVEEGINPAGQPVTLPFALSEDIKCVSKQVTLESPDNRLEIGNKINVRENGVSSDFIVTARDSDNFTYGTSKLEEIYANKGPLIEESYEGGILAAGVFSSPDFESACEYLVLAGPDKAYFYAQGEPLVEKPYASGELIELEDNVQLIQAFNELFLFRSREAEGEFAWKEVTEIVRLDNVAFVTVPDHGFNAGERVRIEGADQAAYNYEFDVAIISKDKFSFLLSHEPPTPATGKLRVRKVKAPLVYDPKEGAFVKTGGGNNEAGPTFGTLMSTKRACYFNNQLCVVRHRDQVLVSDVLDANTFDPVLKSFRCNTGSDDFIVGLQPFNERRLIIFGRKKIYLANIAIDVSGTSIDPGASSIELLTDEIGCIAPDSVAVAGSHVFFLSDNGVYRLDAQFDLKLVGNTMPLSEAVDDIIQTINWREAARSNAVYINNRYYLAIPLEGETHPQTLLIYNTLNDAWESIDHYPFYLDKLVVSTFNNKRRVFAASQLGALFLLEENESGVDDASNAFSPKNEVVGELTTRRFALGSMYSKRWLKALSAVVLPPNSNVILSAILTDPDAAIELQTLTNSSERSEDYAMKGAIRYNSTFCDLKFMTQNGRPIIRTAIIDGAVSAQGSSQALTIK